MTKTMNERFDERFPLQQLHDYHELTAHIARKGEIVSFIQQEIDLAKEEEMKRIVEIIEESKQSIIKGNNITYWKESAEKFIEKIITLITNNNGRP